jgi:hypothetical protein
MKGRVLALACVASVLASFVPGRSGAAERALPLCPQAANPAVNVGAIFAYETGIGDLSLTAHCWLHYKGDVTVQAFARGIYRSGHAFIPITSSNTVTLKFGSRVLATCSRTATPPAFSNCFARSGGFYPPIPFNALLLCSATATLSGAARSDTFLFLEAECSSAMRVFG